MKSVESTTARSNGRFASILSDTGDSRLLSDTKSISNFSKNSDKSGSDHTSEFSFSSII